MRLWLQIILVIALASLIVVLISQNRHPVRTLAWILVLCLLPVVGLFLYLVFGTEKKRMRLISDKRLSDLKGRVVASNEDMIRRSLPNGHTDLATLLWMTNRSVPFSGNDVKVFTRFDDMYVSLMDDLDQACDLSGATPISGCRALPSRRCRPRSSSTGSSAPRSTWRMSVSSLKCRLAVMQSCR